MKNSLFLIIALFTLLATSCSTEGAEKTADMFHQKLDEKDYDYIVDNLADLENETEEGWHAFLQIVDGWGPQTDRNKKMGFSKKINNGITTVKLNYSFNVPEIGKVYEALVLIERENGYKILTAIMNSDESIVNRETEAY